MIERLTTAQRARVRKAYREAYGADDYRRAIDEFYARFELLYGVGHSTLRGIVAEDHLRNHAQYRALRGLRGRSASGSEASKKPERRTRLPDGRPPGITEADYYGRATYCPECHRDFGQNFMPPHGPPPHGCKGSGRFGVTRYTIYMEKRLKKRPRGRGSTSIRAVSGGLPGLGKRH